MLNIDKIRLMSELAMYEKNQGRKYLPITKYYRTDFIGLALIKNFFLVTIGYGLLLIGFLGYESEYLMGNMHKMNLVTLGGIALLGYIIVLVIYSILTYIWYSIIYLQAKRSVKGYYEKLTQLAKLYAKEDKKKIKGGR